MINRREHIRISVRVFYGLTLLAVGVLRAADEPQLEEILPDKTFVALSLPDLEAARKAADSSRIGQMFKAAPMREFLDPIIARMNLTYAQARTANPMIPTLDDVDKGLLNGEVGIGVYSRFPDPVPGVVFSIKPKDVKAFETIFGTMFHGGPIPKDPIPFGREDQPGALYAGGRLLIVMPMTDLAMVAERVTDAQKRAQGTLAMEASFKEGRATMKDSAGWLFVNPSTILTYIDQLIPLANDPELAKVRPVLNALGLDSLRALQLGLSFSGGEPAVEAYIGTNGAPKGIFDLMGTKGASKELFQVAAADAPYVAAGSFDLSKVLPLIRNVAKIVDPNGEKELNDGLAHAAEFLKFDIEKDVLGNLDSEFLFTQTAHDTGAPLSFSPGMVTAVKLKDSARFEECLKKIKELMDMEFAKQRIPALMMQVKTASYKGATIYYLSQFASISGGIVLTVYKDKLLYGDSLNAVRRSIDQLGAGSNILSNKSLQAAVARVSGKPFDPNALPFSFAFSEDYNSGTGTLLLTGLGIAAGTTAIAGVTEAANEGKDVPPPPGPGTPFDELTNSHGGRAAMNILDAVDLNLWPETEFFAQRRQASASVTLKTEKGWFARTEFPPPMPHYGNISPLMVVSVVAIMAVSLTPAFARAREAGRRSVSSDNLKQIHYCLVMYEQEKGKFPDDPADLYPQYTDDVRVFQTPRDPKLDAGYTLIAGLDSANSRALVAFENPPTSSPKSGRNVLTAGGAVMFVTESSFQEMLKQAEAEAKAAGRVFKLVPMNSKEIAKKRKKP